VVFRVLRADPATPYDTIERLENGRRARTLRGGHAALRIAGRGRETLAGRSTSGEIPSARLMTTPFIELDGLTQAYGSLVALSGLTGTIPRASVGLVGANGAGKSTLMKVLLGILKPSAGRASVLGLSVSDDTIAVREPSSGAPAPYPPCPC
jgi:ABC-type multidrug transport system fused ATPase/permease subunit